MANILIRVCILNEAFNDNTIMHVTSISRPYREKIALIFPVHVSSLSNSN